MNAYDFDGTIYDGDSTVDFYMFCLRRQPSLLKYSFIQIYGLTLYIFGKSSKLQFKEKFYLFLLGISDIKGTVEAFWNQNKKIKAWYLACRKTNDVIISASPEFLLKPICNRLGVESLIASNVDCKTGKYRGNNCWGMEKVCQFKQRFKEDELEAFYSDSFSDMPMAMLAKKSYLIKKFDIIEWTMGTNLTKKRERNAEDYVI